MFCFIDLITFALFLLSLLKYYNLCFFILWSDSVLMVMAFWLCVYLFCCFALCLTGLPILSIMFGFVWSDFATLPCGWLNSVVLALYGLVLLFCLDAV